MELFIVFFLVFVYSLFANGYISIKKRPSDNAEEAELKPDSSNRRVTDIYTASYMGADKEETLLYESLDYDELLEELRQGKIKVLPVLLQKHKVDEDDDQGIKFIKDLKEEIKNNVYFISVLRQHLGPGKQRVYEDFNSYKRYLDNYSYDINYVKTIVFLNEDDEYDVKDNSSWSPDYDRD